ncbi:MAG: DUF2063 domain-containing protein [Candidatus Methylumidiphilus sp.]
MAETNFKQIQHAFAAHIRDPEHNPPPPGVRPERMAMYRELFFNNINSFLSSGFPVLRQVLGEARWLALAQDFFTRHRSATPYFAEFHEEFLAFLRDERTADGDPPFLLELAHYEWVELALSLAAEDAPPLCTALQENPLDGVVALSAVAWPLVYRFPVQRIGADFQPAAAPAEPAYLAVYRDRADEVRFVELSPASFRLLQMLEDGGAQPAEACLRQIALEMGAADPAAILAYGADILREFGARGIVGAG